MLGVIFGAKAQLVVGVGLFALTAFQWWWWGFHTKPSTAAVFHVSMEAMAFAAYGIVATALGYRATERVEAHVVNNIEKAEEVNV